MSAVLERLSRSDLGTFSIRFDVPSDPETVYALDWNWQHKGVWGISEKESGYIHWFDIGVLYNGKKPLDSIRAIAYRKLLDAFGLSQWSDELTIEMIFDMSPGNLISIRRSKEKLLNLSMIKVSNQNLGCTTHQAEEYL